MTLLPNAWERYSHQLNDKKNRRGQERGPSPDRALDRDLESGPESGLEGPGDKEGVERSSPERGPHFVPPPNCTHLTPVRLQVQLLVPGEVITVREKQSVI